MKGFYNTCSMLSLFLLFSFATIYVEGQGTRVGFYSRTCPQAETIVRTTLRNYFNSDATVAAGLLRMHFLDCFIRGCDGSVLLDGSSTEKNAIPNLSVKGFDVIEDAKTAIEAACPGVVSCADILALAARDSVVATGGASWQVPTGRRDGLISYAADALVLPGPTDSVDLQKQMFATIGLSTQDLVVLVGAHTIGTTACRFFTNRFGRDSSIDPSFLSQLRSLCPTNGDANRRVALDNGSQNRFDNSFFTNLRNGRGILESDQMLWTDNSTRAIVQQLSPRGFLGRLLNARFSFEFGRSMVRMGNVGVLTGTQGEIRRVCTAINT
ncbi:peroxidase [Ranunculus cassubicifolius]